MHQARGTAVLAGMRVDIVGQGPTVVLLHGLASTRHIWDLVVPLMADRFRLVIPDVRGHGESPVTFDGADPEVVIQDIEALRQVMGVTRAAFVGHSWGAQLALRYTAMYPERVSHLVLIDGGFLDFRLLDGYSRGAVRRQLEPPLLDLTANQYIDLVKDGFGDEWQEAFEPIVLSTMRDRSAGIDPRLGRGAHLAILDSMLDFEPHPALARIQVPTLLVVPGRPGPGDLDWTELRSRSVQVAQNALRRVQLLDLPSSGHDVPLERSEELADAVGEFLQHV